MKLLGVLLLAVLVAASAPAYGGAKETAARAEYEEGTTAYNLGHFDEAALHYEAAYKLVHDPNMLFNIAQSYRLGGKHDKALPVFRAFLRETSTDAPNRGLAERFVEELKRKAEENKGGSAPASPPEKPQPLVEPAPAPVPVPVAPVAPIPAPTAPAPAPPSMPPAQVSVPEPASAVAPVPPAPSPTTATAPAGLLELPRQPEPTAGDRPFYKTWWFWTAVGATVVAGSVTAFLLARRSPDSCDGLGMKCVGVK